MKTCATLSLIQLNGEISSADHVLLMQMQKRRMKDVLTDIQDGTFAKGWILENQANRPNLMQSTQQ